MEWIVSGSRLRADIQYFEYWAMTLGSDASTWGHHQSLMSKDVTIWGLSQRPKNRDAVTVYIACDGQGLLEAWHVYL